MKITLKLEYNTDMGPDSAEYRFYLVFDKNVTRGQIVSLFDKKEFQSPEIVEKDGALHVFINKRTPEPALVQIALEEGNQLLEDYSIVQALETLSNNRAVQLELDQNAIKTLRRSKELAEQALNGLKEIFGDELLEIYYSPFIGANIGLNDPFIESLNQFIPTIAPVTPETKPLDSLDSQSKEEPVTEPNLQNQKHQKLMLNITDVLTDLQQKTSTVEQQHFPEAAEKTKELTDKLFEAQKELASKLDSGTNIQEAGMHFKNTCKKEISDAESILERDLGWGDYLKNILKKIANFFIGLFTSNQNALFQYQQPTSKPPLEKAQIDLAALDPESKVGNTIPVL